MTPAEVQARLQLSDAVMARVEIHRATLAAWSVRMNLVGPRELERYWERHALDSLQLVQHALGAKRWLDFGSGAGFPGLLIAAALADAEVTLVESIAKKGAFLRAAAEAMGVRARVITARIEAAPIGRERFDVVSARAVAPLPRITEYAMPFLRRGALGLFPKGADAEAEIAAAVRAFPALQITALPSLSDSQARIVRIEGAGS